MITAKEAFNESAKNRSEYEIYMEYILERIKKATANGLDEIIIREHHYCMFLDNITASPKEQVDVIKALRNHGYSVDLYYYEGQFVDIGLRINWEKPSEIKGDVSIITAKESLAVSNGNLEQNYIHFFENEIKSAAEKGKTSIVISKIPYNLLIADSSKENKVAQNVAKQLKENGFTLTFNGKEKSDESRLTISWNTY